MGRVERKSKGCGGQDRDEKGGNAGIWVGMMGRRVGGKVKGSVGEGKGVSPEKDEPGGTGGIEGGAGRWVGMMGRRGFGEERGNAGKGKGVAHGQDEPVGTVASG